ncbi:hypothetical protein PN36_05350 [Candidatus Thiomargarita nelsonii]|uniref:Uncharacterized protein n=1 Tax=Candidatus Thiomargarita nelsonii TaxID=1003181 RepID=A0A0A6PAQ3_9GAMM|nr:hypothetical protein PN36_05350 [Candidatus Thiomargarita nelsonii]
MLSMPITGTLYYLNSSWVWTVSPGPTYQGPLTNLLTPITIYNGTSPFPSGAIVDFYFGVDLSMNGVWDAPYRYAMRTVQIP